MDEPVVDTELADSEPRRRSGPWKLIVVVAVLTLIGVWLVPGTSQRKRRRWSTGRTLPGEPGQTTGAPSLLSDGPGAGPRVIGTRHRSSRIQVGQRPARGPGTCADRRDSCGRKYRSRPDRRLGEAVADRRRTGRRLSAVFFRCAEGSSHRHWHSGNRPILPLVTR